MAVALMTSYLFAPVNCLALIPRIMGCKIVCGLVGAVNVILEARLNTNQLVTDSHKQNTAWIKRNLPGVKHFFET